MWPGPSRSGGQNWEASFDWPLPNVWLGVSVEDQVRAEERIPLLLVTPAAKRFVSCEPLLGAVDLRQVRLNDPGIDIDSLTGAHGVSRPMMGVDGPSLDWVIAGGESGPRDVARRPEADWFRALRDQCAAAGTPFFFKQWGEYAPSPAGPMLYYGKREAGHLLDGREHFAFPDIHRTGGQS